jgi:hypothetical protein
VDTEKILNAYHEYLTRWFSHAKTIVYRTDIPIIRVERVLWMRTSATDLRSGIARKSIARERATGCHFKYLSFWTRRAVRADWITRVLSAFVQVLVDVRTSSIAEVFMKRGISCRFDGM